MEINRVWFVSHYSMPPEYEMRIKTQMYAHFLGLMGIDCTIFSASTIHNTDINLISDGKKFIEKQYDDLKFVHIRCDQYTGNGFARIKNMMQFANGFSRIANSFEPPDVVVADVNCISYEKIYKYCRANNIPLYVDMRDLWPDSIVEYLHYSKKNPIIKYLYHRERVMYRRVDGVIFSMEGGKQYIQDKHWKDISLDKIYYINNGVDIDKFNEDITNYRLSDDDLENNSTFKIVYAGSIRTANNVEAIVKAAELIKDQTVMFLIYGDGDQRKPLEAYCEEKKVLNVKFKGRVEKQFIPYILSRCNLSILNYQKADTWKYGGSQNKLFEYMAAGHPIMQTVRMNYSLIDKRKCGVVIDEPDPRLIAEKVMEIKNAPRSQIKEMSQNAIETAKEFDYRSLTEKLYSIISNR